MNYLVNNFDVVAKLFLQHLQLTLAVIFFSLLIGIPLGLLLARVRWLRGPVMSVLGIIYTIPSLSFFVLLIPLFGLGTRPAIIALTAYAQLLLIRNWLVGLTTIEPAVLEAARGMGLNGWQRFWQIEFPLALPMLLAGIRLVALSSIGIGTIAAFINAGGLGVLLFQGVITANYDKIFTGALAVTVLSFAANYFIRYLEQRAEFRIYGKRI
ncbi:MAG: ABC transporter permease [Chloroflexi bacterium HGW-Chloroflexi-2]|jgi:osmoprotectant transport system permease protein|nr:MAG: ABC transporter permease [Chloroflexi bacterium HGW-Chloroflexi-2]